MLFPASKSAFGREGLDQSRSKLCAFLMASIDHIKCHIDIGRD